MSVVVKIAVVEPSVIIRSGLLAVLKRLPAFEAEIVEIADLTQLISTLNWRKPDVLIVNPAFLGVFSLQQVKNESKCRQMRCIALQNGSIDSSVLRPYDETISIYDSAEQIREKLFRVTHDTEREESREESLSDREKEIVVGVVKGLTNKQIADQLCLSTHTVITHRRNIAAKLQIHSPAGLTIYAIVNKLVELNEVKDMIRRNE